MSELNTRQWALYNFLKEQGDEWTTQYEVAFALVEHYGKPDKDNFHDSKARLQMTRDIRKINTSSVIQKVIISSPKGIKIANAEEFDRHVQKEIKAAIRKLLRAKQKAAKELQCRKMPQCTLPQREVCHERQSRSQTRP